LGLKYLNSLRIRDPGWRQFGSGIRDGKKSDPGIRDKHPGSATLICLAPFSLLFHYLFSAIYSLKSGTGTRYLLKAIQSSVSLFT
jgi:hypothetical protein